MAFPQQGCNVWYLNNTIGLSGSYSVNFVSNGQEYVKIGIDVPLGGVIYYEDSLGNRTLFYNGYNQTWRNAACRTIIFETRPTGDLLTWIQSNATEKSYSAEAWFFNSSLSLPSGESSFDTSFTCKNYNYVNIVTNSLSNGVNYATSAVGMTVYRLGSWTDEQYRTIVFETAPTGDLLNLLNSNATKVASGIVLHTVTFDMQGHGTQIASQSIEDGNTATEPTAPTASGYVFGGWYNESACTTPFNFSTPITADKTLYAKWTKAYTMIGVNGTAKRVSKAYIGVSGVAKKVKKIYIGVNGVAKQIF